MRAEKIIGESIMRTIRREFSNLLKPKPHVPANNQPNLALPRTPPYGFLTVPLTVPFFVSACVMFEHSIRIFQSSPSRITDQYPLICVGPKFSPLMVELHAPVTHICLLSRPMLQGESWSIVMT